MDEGTAIVIFQPSGRRGEVPKGITVIEASRLLGVDVEALCGEKESAENAWFESKTGYLKNSASNRSLLM